MKKVICTLFVAACLFMAVPAQAQFQWGLKAGMNLNKAKLSGNLKDNFKADNTTGFFVGPMVEFTMPLIGLGVDGSVLYSQRKMDLTLKETGRGQTLKQHALDIPINLKYSIGLGSLASFFVAAGPCFSFDLKSDDLKINKVFHTITDEKPKSLYDKANVSLNVGVGAKLLQHLQIGVNYNWALTNSAKAEFENPDVAGIGKSLIDGSFKNNGWQVSLAYMF